MGCISSGEGRSQTPKTSTLLFCAQSTAVLSRNLSSTACLSGFANNFEDQTPVANVVLT